MANLSAIHEHMEVIGADGVPVGIVDRVENGRIKLVRQPPAIDAADAAGGHAGHRHYIPGGLVAEIEGDKVRLSANADIAVAIFEEEA